MWIALSNSFLSIAAHPKKPDLLVVRAHAAGDIERVFPGAHVRHTPKRNYLYRADITNVEVMAAIAAAIRRITYPNFAGTLNDDDRYTAYSRCWATMRSWGRGIMFDDMEKGTDHGLQ